MIRFVFRRVLGLVPVLAYHPFMDPIVDLTKGAGRARGPEHRRPRIASGVQQVQPPLLIGKLRNQPGQGDLRAGGGSLGGRSPIIPARRERG